MGGKVGKVDWSWQPPLASAEPMAAVAIGPMMGKLLQLLRSRLASLLDADPKAEYGRLAYADQLLVFIGPMALLPWLEGIHYAARSVEAPTLWLPTHAQPTIHPALLLQALVSQHQRQPLLLWPEPALVMPLDRLLPVTLPILNALQEKVGPHG